MNNETIGQSAEKALCLINNIDCNIDNSRTNDNIVNKIINLCNNTNNNLPSLKESIGYKNGPVDFITTNNETVSLKTLKRNDGKIAPQKIGQPSTKKFDEIWGLDYEKGLLKYNNLRFEFIKSNINHMLNEMLKNQFCCDITILIYNVERNPKMEVFRKINDFDYFTNKNILFLRNIYEEKWDSKKNKYSEFSTKVYMLNNNNLEVDIGEFQFHKNSREQVKFRFYKKFLLNNIV